MKKFRLFIYLGLMVAALSCTKEIEPSHDFSREMVELTIRAATGQTKAADTSLEEGINFLQVFIFSEDGRLESVTSSKSSSVTLRCFKGDKDIYAVVNHSEEIEWTSEMTASDLLETVFSLDGGLNIMFGRTGVASDKFPSESSVTVDMEVKRIAARFVLRQVINNTTASGGGDVKICGAYLINVVNCVKLCDLYSGTASDFYSEAECWYNKTKYNGDMDELLYSGEMNEVIGTGDTATFDQYFYCYPNFTVDDSNKFYKESLGWDPRFTRLVMEAEYNGDDVYRYYVVSISGVWSNYSYEVTFDITGPGSSVPEPMDNVFDGHSGGSGGSEGGGGGDWDISNPYLSSRRSLTEDGGGTVVYFPGGSAVVRECGL